MVTLAATPKLGLPLNTELAIAALQSHDQDILSRVDVNDLDPILYHFAARLR